MRHRDFLPALLLLVSTMLAAAEGMPAGLPHERIVLHDGRQLTGHYDEAQGVLWLDGAGSPRLRVTPSDIAKRTPIVIAEKGKKTQTGPRVPLPTVRPSPESLQQTVTALERQLADLDKRMEETRDALNKINAHFHEWLKVYAKARKLAEADPGTGLGFENNASYNLTKILSEIKAVRDQVTRQEDALARQTERRKDLLAELGNAQRALAEARNRTPTAAVAVYTVEVAPPASIHLEQRIEALEAELRVMRETNERLLKLLEALAPAKPETPRPSPSVSDPVDGLVAILP
jgi:DNA repair exonuclease SbcCD ATPase subunit